MLIETMIVFLLILPISITSTWVLRNDFEKSYYRFVLLFGPVVDAWITWYLLDFFEIGFFGKWASVISIGIISCMLLQPFLSPRRQVTFRLSWQQIRRRPRQAALMMAGLLIASSIITSSLVIGDSLDATLSKEVEAIYGDTDIQIFQKDRRTGFSFDLDSNLTSSFGQELTSSGIADKWNHGIDSVATISNEVGLAIPSAAWFAYSGWEGVAINQVVSDELGVEKGDVIELTWFSYTDDAELERSYQNLTITSVIPMEGKGSMAGSKSPALFTSLEISQLYQSKENKVNMLRISLSDSEDATSQVDDISSVLDDLIGYESSGFEISTSEDAISISNTNGLGRLDSKFMDSWHENESSLVGSGSVMEVLQIPLIQIQQEAKILSLPDDRITEILATDEGDWYVSGGGVSFQKERNGGVHSWEAPDGGLINDVTLLENSLLVAYTDGLVEIPNDSDDDVIHHLKGEEKQLAALFTQELPDLPVTIFSIDYLRDSEIDYIAVKHLTGSEVHRYSENSWEKLNLTGEWLHFDNELMVGSQNSGWETLSGVKSPENWLAYRGGYVSNNGSLYSFNGSVSFESVIPADCDNRVFEMDQELLCSTSFGTIVASQNIVPRLPSSVDIGGFGVMPQMLLATDGQLSPEQGKLLISSRLSLLNQSNNVLLNGLVPWAYGDNTPHILKIDGNMTSLEAPGIDELESIIIGFVNLTDGEILASSEDGERSILVVTEGNNTEIESWLDDYSGVESMDLRIVAAKEEALIAAEEGAGVLSAMFLVFGAFTIGAGLLLVLTIIIMLANSRRMDEGVIRAIGMKRSDMRSLSLMEGMINSSIASVIGGLFGLLLAWIVAMAFSSVFSSAGADGIDYSFSFESMLIGASAGFLIAMFTLYLTAFWTSKLSIVEALRGLSPARKRGIPWWLLLLMISFTGGGLLSGLTILTLESNSSLRFAMWHLSVSLLIIGIIPVFTYVIPHLRKMKIRNTGRNTISSVGICLILWALTPDSWVPVSNGVKPDEVTFAVQGMIQVIAGVMVLTGLAPRIASWLVERSPFSKKFGAVTRISLAYPSSTPLKTAVIMGMFSLTVFSVVVLAGYSVQFEEHSSGYVEDASGEFEILLSSSRQLPLELSDDVNEWNLSNSTIEDIDAIGRISRAVVWVEEGEDRIPYILRGVDTGFVEHGAIPLEDWDRALGQTQIEAWKSVKSNPNIVFIDSSFALVDPNTGESISGLSLSIGKSILLIDISNPGNARNVTVGGILSQSSQLFSAGIWMDGEIVNDQYGGVVTRIYVSHDSNLESSELEESLTQDLASQGVNSSIIKDEILLILGLVFAILLIFQAYLALGLIVGIGGIGVVTYRSVSERSNEIGMLRALGFRKKMVMSSMLIEVSWTSLMGIINGALVAVGFHVALHSTFWKEQNVDLILPWQEIILIITGGWILVMISTIIPVKRAVSISPSEAISVVD